MQVHLHCKIEPPNKQDRQTHGKLFISNKQLRLATFAGLARFITEYKHGEMQLLECVPKLDSVNSNIFYSCSTFIQ